MADVHRVYRICEQCDGVGHLLKVTAGESGQTTTEEDCPSCGGEKYYLWGWTTDAVFNSATELDGL